MLTCVVEKLKLCACKQFHFRTEHMYIDTAVKLNHHGEVPSDSVACGACGKHFTLLQYYNYCFFQYNNFVYNKIKK